MKRIAAALGFGLVGLGAAPASHAGVADTMGIEPRDIALGGSLAARPGSFAAAYYNPAGLSPGGSVPADPPGFAEVGVGFTYARPLVYVERPDGGSVELAEQPHDTAGVMLGTRFDLGHAFGLRGLNVGLALYLPTAGIFSWYIHPDEKVQWLFLSDRSLHIGIHLGLGWRATSWLSVGVGMRALFDVESFNTGRVTQVESTVDPDTGQTVFDVRTQLGEEVTVYGRLAPNVGLLLTPTDWLRLGASYRGKLYSDDWGWTRLQGVPGSGDLGYMHRFAHYFQPHEVVAAVAGEPLEGLWLSADLRWSHWSEALTAYFQELGPGRFGDTWTPSVGVEWEVGERVSLLGGYRYVPSPFNNFGGPTNLLDNDQHVASTGVDVHLGELAQTGLELSLRYAARLALLVPREETKDPRRFASDAQYATNPGVPGYRHGGTIPGGSFAVEASW